MMVIAVIINEKNQDIQLVLSSCIQICFWGALVIYAGINLAELNQVYKYVRSSLNILKCLKFTYVIVEN